MAYFTRVEMSVDRQRRAYPNSLHIQCPSIVVHDGCLPAEQFEMVKHSAGDFRHQREPWCWAPLYGGDHACFYCERRVP
jgi:hypothetical protein